MIMYFCYALSLRRVEELHTRLSEYPVVAKSTTTIPLVLAQLRRCRPSEPIKIAYNNTGSLPVLIHAQ